MMAAPKFDASALLDGLLLLQSREERMEYLLLNADLLLKDCHRV